MALPATTPPQNPRSTQHCPSAAPSFWWKPESDVVGGMLSNLAPFGDWFESAIYGDPVEVTGTSVPLSAADGDIYDWSYTWDEWLAKGTPSS